ncbi:hypothetical protein L6452_00881 [Arctium lappa]|uniref:Uncharacterized protein n=1 Tax=Arctium lappa TaxID=4217 RepID=A0ACB9FFS4_ARCLA|nr:hypothetical protein L6452_00881 [Arctium lappa]
MREINGVRERERSSRGFELSCSQRAPTVPDLSQILFTFAEPLTGHLFFRSRSPPPANITTFLLFCS